MTARRSARAPRRRTPTRLPGTYTITLTVTDSWNRAGAPVTRDGDHDRAGRQPGADRGDSLLPPARRPTRRARSPAPGPLTRRATRRCGTCGSWGDGTPDSTTASGSHVFPVAGTYTVTLTVSDAWGRAGAPVTRTGDDVAGASGQHRADRHVPAARLHGAVVRGEQHRDHRPGRHPRLLVELG